jgi:hypothetical protein
MSRLNLRLFDVNNFHARSWTCFGNGAHGEMLPEDAPKLPFGQESAPVDAIALLSGRI